MIDVDSARVGLFKSDNPNQGALWIFNGNGQGGGLWLETPVRLPVDPRTGRCLQWHRLTLRTDPKRQVWDLWLDTHWAAASMGFQDPHTPGETSYIFMGDRRGLFSLDELLITPMNPLIPDADADGLGDALEQSLGLDQTSDDREQDPDGDGLTQLDRAIAKLSETAKPLEASAVHSVTVTLSRSSALMEAPIQVKVALSGPVATLRYTLDGSDPSDDQQQNKPLARDGSQAIDISSTTVLRVAALSTKGEVLGSASAAYLFPADIAKFERPHNFPVQLHQSTAPVPLRYGSPQVGDILLDAAAVDRTLRAAPIVVLATSPKGWFHPASGVYSANANRLKRPVEVLLFERGGRAISKTTSSAKVALSGETSLSHIISPKHSLRLQWDSVTSGSENGESLPQGRELLLRHPTHDSWVQNGDRARRREGIYIADAFAADAMARAGHPTLSHRWVHVFLNGGYWGVYDAVEQLPTTPGRTLLKGEPHGPVSAVFGQEARWQELMHRLKALASFTAQGVATGDGWEKAAAQLDLDNLIDYIIINIWMQTTDWPVKNFLITQATPSAPFQFLTWDAEMALRPLRPGESEPLVRIREAPDGPAAAFTQLSFWPLFRQRILQRARHLFTEKGALTPASALTALTAQSTAFRNLATLEAGRWVSQFDGLDPTAIPSWEARIQSLNKDFLPSRATSTHQSIQNWSMNIDKAAAAAAQRNLLTSLRPQGPQSSASPSPTHTTLADTDADGLPDNWELQHKLDPTNAADAALDNDKDGLSNREEHALNLDPNKRNKKEDYLPPPETTVYSRIHVPMIKDGKEIESFRHRQGRGRGRLPHVASPPPLVPSPPPLDPPPPPSGP